MRKKALSTEGFQCLQNRSDCKYKILLLFYHQARLGFHFKSTQAIYQINESMFFEFKPLISWYQTYKYCDKLNSDLIINSIACPMVWKQLIFMFIPQFLVFFKRKYFYYDFHKYRNRGIYKHFLFSMFYLHYCWLPDYCPLIKFPLFYLFWDPSIFQTQ